MDTWLEFAGETGVKNAISLSEIEHLIRVPQIRQTDGYGCGVACLESVLYFYGKELDYETIKKAVKATPENGTDHREIVKFVRSLGLEVEVRKGMTTFELQDLIDQEKPVILVLQAWAGKGKNVAQGWDSGHYAVGIGYDSNNIYMMDPSTLGHYAYIPIEEFISRWHDKDGSIRLVHAGIVINGKKKYDPEQLKKLQ